MANDRRAAVVKKLLDDAGLEAGDLMRLAESLPPETIAQFDKLLNHKEPSVGPGMDSGIVVAYKSGEVVQDRPMQGNFSKEGIAVYEDGGAVDVGENKSSFTIGDIISRVREEGLPANARAYLRSVFERATGGEPPVFGADYFTDRQLERIRELAEARQRQGYEDVENFAYPDTPSMESYKYYGGPSLPYGLDSLLTDIVDPETILKTSLGGFQIYDEGDHWRINDPFDFTGVKVKGLDTVRHHIVESDNAYSLLRRIAPTLIANEPSRYALDKPSDEWTPRFSFTIPKEGPVREGPGERPPRVKNYEAGGYVPSPKDKPRSPVGQELYGLGDVEYRAELEPYLSEVVDPRSTSRSPGPLERLEDDYVALMGLRALEQKHGGDYGEFIDTDARRLDPYFSENANVSGVYDTELDKIRVKTTPTKRQIENARSADEWSQTQISLGVPASQYPGPSEVEMLRAYYSRPMMLQTVGHELFHAGMNRINENASVAREHRALTPIDWERLRKTPEGRAVIPVMQKTVFKDNPVYQPEKPFRYEDIRDLQAEARDRYEQMGPPRVKNYEDGGAVEPRPTGFTLSSGRPVWQSGDDLYSEKTITVPYGDGWVVMPTVDVDGNIMSEDEVSRLLDQIGPVDVVTGAELPVFSSLSDADRYAEDRSNLLGDELVGLASLF